MVDIRTCIFLNIFQAPIYNFTTSEAGPHGRTDMCILLLHHHQHCIE